MQRMSERLAGDLLGQMEAQAASSRPPQSAASERIDAVARLAQAVKDASDDLAGRQAAWVALSQLQGMSRGNEISYLNIAAAALAGVTGTSGVVAVFFGAFGFQSADVQRLFRDQAGSGLTFVVLAAAALLVGTFAVALDAGKSNRNLWAERAAVYLGVLCLCGALVVGAVGLTRGASATKSAPELATASDSSGGMSAMTVTAKAHAVPKSRRLQLVVWGTTNGTSWTMLQQGSSGPGSDGSALVAVRVPVSAGLHMTELAAASAVGGLADALANAAPAGCAQLKTNDGIARSCVHLTSTATDTAPPTN